LRVAAIQRFPFLRHLRAGPTAHVRHLAGSKVVHDGVGQSFWFAPLSAVLSEIPVDDREQPLLVHARTSDFQEVSVQLTVTYRVADPAVASARIDFGIDPRTGRWQAAPLEQLGGLLAELAQQQVLHLCTELPLIEALATGPARLHERLTDSLVSDPRLAQTGVVVVGVRVLAVRPEPEVERALQTPARELVQQEADRATYERRALAVEREGAIAENELQNQIELAHREQQLVAQRGANERLRSTEAAAAALIEAESAADRDRVSAAGRAEATRVVGEARADSQEALLAAYRDAEPATLLAIALRELAGNLPPIGDLHLSPDLLSTLAGQFAGGQLRARSGGSAER
jgi:regulator of protease activity HflC (stomatin/prohibitin superfamily)